MTKPGRFSARLLGATLLLGSAVAGTSARAQDFPLVVADGLLEPVDPEEMESEAEAAPSDWVFNSWIFGQETSAADFRENLELALMLRLEYIERVCTLTASQKKKIELAGQGDIKHFFDRIAEKRRLYHQAGSDEQKLSDIEQDVEKLAEFPRKGLFDASSIFAKSLRATLSSEQLARYVAAIRETNRLRFQGSIEQAVAFFDTAVGLSDRQRQQLKAFLRQRVRPLKQDSELRLHSILMQTCRLPDASYKAILDERQWRLLKHLMQKMREEMGEIEEIELADEVVDEVEIPRSIVREVTGTGGEPKRVQIRVENTP